MPVALFCIVWIKYSTKVISFINYDLIYLV
jgi:hypothetical protein